MTTPDTTPTDPRFRDLGLAPEVLEAVRSVGYEAPTPIQARAIPPLLAGRDLLGQAQTGTGKTAAFALPALSRIDLGLRRPQVVVLTPTRELAIQVAEAMQTYGKGLPGFHVLPIYGGQSIHRQLQALRRGVHAVVGTPGRILDHLGRKTLPLDALRFVVLDEGDEMLRMGFIEDVEEILDHMPPSKQVALFSATLPPRIQKIAGRHLRDPVRIEIEARTVTVETIDQRYWRVTGVHKLDALTRILETADFDGVLVFVRTRIATEELADRLAARGFEAGALHGDMNQAQREETVEALRKGDLDIVVATDVAARGLDVERISHVVNYDVPHDTDAYVHRIGRTGRAGTTGEAILFVAPRETRMLRAIERAIGQTIEPMELPTREDVTRRRREQLARRLDEVIATEDLEPFEALVSRYRSERDHELLRVAAALAYLTPTGRQLSEDPPAETPEPPARSWQPAPSGGVPPIPRGRPADAGLQRYRIAVGHRHGVEPKHIVGAIANEAGLDARRIGKIDIHDTFSVVDLPQGMPKEIYRHLKTVQVLGHELRITPDARDDRREPVSRPRRGPQAKKPRDKSGKGPRGKKGR
jgi:ATP-dependent RNA helicase DeaD